jgi:selenocysteine-specific elongation factor
VLVALCCEAQEQGIPLAELPVRLGVAPNRVALLINGSAVFATTERVYTREVRDAARQALIALVDASHASDPLAVGVPIEDARAKLRVPPDLFAVIVEELAASGVIVLEGATVHAPDWKPRLDSAQSQLAERIMTDFSGGADPTVSIASITTNYGADSVAVVRHLEHTGLLVRLGETLISPAPVVDGMVERLRKHMEPGRTYSPGQLREELGISRRILIPLLEYCDRVKVTERRGGDRVLRTP